MGDVVPLNNLITPKQVLESFSEVDLEKTTDIAVVRINEDGEMFVSYNRMTAERMFYMAGIMQRYALSL